MSKIKIQLYNHMVLDHAKFDAMMLGCCGCRVLWLVAWVLLCSC